MIKRRYALFVAMGLAFFCPAAGDAQTPVEIQQRVFTKYCVTCHNQKLRTAELLLDKMDLAHVGESAEQWEKVVRKLRSNTMPPPGLPRPDAATYDSAAKFLETELDRAAAGNPNPGKLPLLHRLSRTEYQNAVRDLLALDWLPKEMDYSLLLPPDNVSSGFDNIADLLFVSPSTMESYLGAARKIARLAVGDPNIPVGVNIHHLSLEQLQDARVEDLPFGTRGGLAVRSTFPLDGDYVVKVEFTSPPRVAEQLEISVDGQRALLTTLTPFVRVRGAVPPKPPEFRIPVKAGPRLVGITFIQRSEARDEQIVRPRTRGRGFREPEAPDAEPAVSTVSISGPYDAQGPGDTPSRRRIFVCHPPAANAAPSPDEVACANRVLSALIRRAYRRPASDADVRRLMPFYASARAEGGFEAGIQKALERLLVSPQFLFRIERDPPGIAPGTPYRISDLELASRLSFLLWSSIPDDELLDLAINGKLKDPAVLERQARRMLADPRSESMVTNFAAQWLYLRDIDSKDPDEVLFPNFDENLRAALHEETNLFIDSVLREDQSVIELLTANYTFLNERLARHYGIRNIEGSYFRRVLFPEGSVRGGLLGQGSILSITSYANRTSPVLRGKWVLENLLSAPPPPPPPNVPALKTEGAQTGKPLTMREAMIQHRANPVCASCHARMDPIGFAMENFDAVGQWRDTDSGNSIDTSGIFPDGTRFNGMAGLKNALLVHPEEFVSTVAGKLLMYAVGRNLQYYDEPSVRAIVHAAAADNYRFSSLLLGVVKSSQFQMRESQTKATSAVARAGSQP